MYGALTCGTCRACVEGRDNLCENVAGIMGFHVDGFARQFVNMPERLVIPVPDGVSDRDAACAPIAFSTVQHMLFDNAKLQPGETVLVQAGGSGIGTVAIMMAKQLGCTVITTVGDDSKIEGVRALGADHVINYRKDRFEHETRRITRKKGVDVVFEHVGADTFNGSLLTLKRGGRLVTLRLDIGADHDHQSDATVSATISHLWIVRCDDAQYRGEPQQDGERNAAGDRYGSEDRRRRGRVEAHGKPSGVRQDHRRVLMHPLLARTKARFRKGAKSLGAAAVGASAVGLLRTTRYFDPIKTANIFGRITRLIGPRLREQQVGRENLTAAFPEKSPEEIEKILAGVWDNLGRVGAEFAHLDHIWNYDPAHPGNGRIEFDPRSAELYDRLRDDGKPALFFASHLGNWELPALAAAAHGLDTAILYRRPNIASADRIIREMRAVNMGTLIPTGRDAPYRLAQALQNRPACRHAGRPISDQRCRGHVLWPQDPGQSNAGAAAAADRMPNPRGADRSSA